MRQTLASYVYEGADMIDSRDVIARIEELAAEEVAPESLCPAFREPPFPCPLSPEDCEREHVHEDMDEDDKEELAKLRKLAEEGEGSPDWAHGETLISEDYFQEYAEELARDMGSIPKMNQWPLAFIDWAAAADALKADYMSLTYGSTMYWIRA